jgi:hypothetical protein
MSYRVNKWVIKHRGRGFIITRGEVTAFPVVDRWYWWLYAPYMIFLGCQAVANYRD